MNLKAGRIYSLEVIAARIHLAHCLGDMIREMGKVGFCDEEAR
jgi:hypothetical protein